MTVDVISIGEYFNLSDTQQYDNFIDIMKPKNRFAGRSCLTKNLTFDQVEVMKQIFSEPNVEDIKDLFIMCFGIKGDMNRSETEVFFSQSVFDLFSAKRFLQNYLKEISERESTWFKETRTDEKLLRVNASERLRPFSHILTKIRLAEKFSKTPNEIGEWKYNDVFAILVALKTQENVMQDYNEIKH